MPHASGERHYAARLTKAKVISLRMLHNTPCQHCGQRLTVRALARMFGVAKGTAGHALTGRNWDIPGFASVGRNPKGEDREDGLRAEHEHAVAATSGETPDPSHATPSPEAGNG
jgi:hypothetical protein